MTASVTEQQWDAVRGSVRTTADRFCELVASIPDPGTRATATWSVADMTAHVTTVSFLNTLLLQAAPVPFDMPGLTAAIAGTTIETVDGLNDQVMSHFTEREAGRLLEILRDHIGLMLTASQDRDPAETFSWLGGARLPLTGMFAHMLNELLIHGDDIARATGARWAMPAADAALFFDLFLIGLASGNTGHLLDGSKRPLRRRIAVEFRSGYTTPVTFVVRNGTVTAEPPGPGADAAVRFDPATLNMMLFGRISKPRAVLTRKIVISGRRPWLMPAFLRTVRLPSLAKDQQDQPRHGQHRGGPPALPGPLCRAGAACRRNRMLVPGVLRTGAPDRGRSRVMHVFQRSRTVISGTLIAAAAAISVAALPAPGGDRQQRPAAPLADPERAGA